LIAVQLLDGVGAGIFGALTPLLLADLMRGTGRYNLAQGAVGTVQGIGASSSGLVAGIIVDHLGYNAAFTTAAAVAAVAFAVLAIAMPETAPRRRSVKPDPGLVSRCSGRERLKHLRIGGAANWRLGLYRVASGENGQHV